MTTTTTTAIRYPTSLPATSPTCADDCWQPACEQLLDELIRRGWSIDELRRSC